METGSAYAFIGKDDNDEMELDYNEVVLDSDTTTTTNKRTTPDTNAPEKVILKKATTNIINVNLGTLSDESKVVTGDPVSCRTCRAILSNINGVTTNTTDGGLNEALTLWTCEFCGEVNPIRISKEEIPKSDIVDYLLETAPVVDANNNNKKKVASGDGLLIYCIDTSGSMSSAVIIPPKLTPEEKAKLEKEIKEQQERIQEQYRIQEERLKQLSQQQQQPVQQHQFVQQPIQQQQQQFIPQQQPIQQQFTQQPIIPPLQQLPMYNNYINRPPQSLYQTPLVSTGTSVSRLKLVNDSVTSQIEELEKEEPNKVVGLVSFSSEVTVQGDGSSKPIVTKSDFQSMEKLNQFGSKIEVSTPISRSKDVLKPTINSLSPHGGTALGPGVLIALGIASRVRGSKVVICTDGYATDGIGAITSDFEKDSVQYEKISQLAVDAGTTISVLGFRGSECKMEHLGKMAELTNGEVSLIDGSNAGDVFKDASSLPVIATNVEIQIRLHRALYIAEPLQQTSDSCFLIKNIGNVNKETTTTFEYGLNPATSSKYDFTKLKAIPFQLQITYRTLTGAKCMRVITMTKLTTSDINKALENANIDALGVNMVQTSSKVASNGDYLQSRARNINSNQLIGKAFDVQKKKLESSSSNDDKAKLDSIEKKKTVWSSQAQNFESKVSKTMQRDSPQAKMQMQQLQQQQVQLQQQISLNMGNLQLQQQQQQQLQQVQQQQQCFYNQRKAQRNDDDANYLYNMNSTNVSKMSKFNSKNSYSK